METVFPARLLAHLLGMLHGIEELLAVLSKGPAAGQFAHDWHNEIVESVGLKRGVDRFLRLTTQVAVSKALVLLLAFLLGPAANRCFLDCSLRRQARRMFCELRLI